MASPKSLSRWSRRSFSKAVSDSTEKTARLGVLLPSPPYRNGRRHPSGTSCDLHLPGGRPCGLFLQLFRRRLRHDFTALPDGWLARRPRSNGSLASALGPFKENHSLTARTPTTPMSTRVDGAYTTNTHTAYGLPHVRARERTDSDGSKIVNTSGHYATVLDEHADGSALYLGGGG